MPMPRKPKKLVLVFEPLDKSEHAKAQGGSDVPDYCKNCFLPFKEHVNGVCPPDTACGAGTTLTPEV